VVDAVIHGSGKAMSALAVLSEDHTVSGASRSHRCSLAYNRSACGNPLTMYQPMYATQSLYDYSMSLRSPLAEIQDFQRLKQGAEHMRELIDSVASKAAEIRRTQHDTEKVLTGVNSASLSLAEQLLITQSNLNDTVEVISLWRKQFLRGSAWGYTGVIELFGSSVLYSRRHSAESRSSALGTRSKSCCQPSLRRLHGKWTGILRARCVDGDRHPHVGRSEFFSQDPYLLNIAWTRLDPLHSSVEDCSVAGPEAQT
jgi:hypothetical protein